ncbi:MOSC domain-containing protein [Aquibacillus sp. 3ASR75-11]|uniref:MOSC domain-containing protein n=1 Tax=Terrihalobacillus insolitus TaxID=2950438 RepID=A0A9X3WP72_9BACI|nr:MOSC domain-containing protein [Terrihalobacillus insolitus]MDC3411936.1 MOSC domain-containing protein [Terrihalobacillus insolitus]MDC3423377.1 MOSC domain-containing protein [Terrihalobacillus insolitus]
MLIGHIKEIVRHPVKSFRGESVQQTKIMDYGLYGDRSHAYLDETKKGDFLTITQFQEMVRYKARFAGEESMNKYPKVEVTTPEGKDFDWKDQELIKELKNKSKRKISTTEYTPSHVPIGPIAVEHVLLATDASLEKLNELWGEDEVDSRRFRPNLILSLIEKKPFIEEEWIGRRIKIGNEVEMEFVGHCKRCMIITVNPDNAERDSGLHKTIIKENNNIFGVYASVIKKGDIHVGDEVSCRA